MRTILLLFSISLIMWLSTPVNLFSQEDHEEENVIVTVTDSISTDIDESTTHEVTVEIASHSGEEANAHHEAHAGEEHSEEHSGSHTDMSPLFFIIIALVIGAATRQFFKKIPVPFTVLLLIFGLILGVLYRLDLFQWSETFHNGVKWAGEIDPHLILYIFLPTLIFEAAFAMDVHTFKKSVANAVILAVPGIIIAMLLTALLVLGITEYNIGLAQWDWQFALLFGIVISATDPVAVVALLKELGASKKLGTLIEGESMLNDGTAIVIFLVIWAVITGSGSDASAVVQFGQIAIGGTMIGIVIAAVSIAWVRRVFNDAMVEISVIIAAAYVTFFIAENFLHVSGVLGLVALGLAMSGIGRTRISPEVEHFLHEFWELAAFIANTLIFIIVGVVIAERIHITASNLIVLFIVYIGIHVVRGIVILMFYPIMKRLGYGLPPKDAWVAWYGALRGAVGLALGLMVAGENSLPQEIRDEFLFLTAGIVILTLLINATTIGALVRKLGLTKLAPAKAMMIYQAKDYLRSSTENQLDRIKSDRFINSANWSAVKEYLPGKVEPEMIQTATIDTIAEMRKRVLEKEKSSYWHQFKEGLLGATAVRRLSDGIDSLLDDEGFNSLSHRADLEDLMKTPPLLSWMQTIPVIRHITRKAFFERLAVSYDCARGFIEAQEEALKLVASMSRSVDEKDKEATGTLVDIETEVNENKIEGLTFIRNLRKTYPEIYDAIATRQAIRTLLNYELKTIERLQKNGRIESDEAHKLIHSVEERMKKLLFTPPQVKIQKAGEYLSEVSWLDDIDSQTMAKLGTCFHSKVFSVGNHLIKEKASADGIYLIARGNVKIESGGQVIDVIGEGNIVGEMALISGGLRTASVVAETPVTAFYMSSENFANIIKSSPEFKERIWRIAAQRYAHNILKQSEPYCYWRPKKFRNWLASGTVQELAKDELVSLDNKVAILVSGEIKVDNNGTHVKAPIGVNVDNFTSMGSGRLLVLDKIED